MAKTAKAITRLPTNKYLARHQNWQNHRFQDVSCTGAPAYEWEANMTMSSHNQQISALIAGIVEQHIHHANIIDDHNFCFRFNAMA